MSSYTLRLHTDQLSPKSEARLPACNRVVYVRDGDTIVRAGAHAAGLAANSAWYGGDAIMLTAGTAGATLLRWELTAENAVPAGLTGPGVTSSITLAHAVELAHPDGHLMRCDRVDFPPGGIAYAHVHRGPGIRSLLAGGSASIGSALGCQRTAFRRRVTGNGRTGSVGSRAGKRDAPRGNVGLL